MSSSRPLSGAGRRRSPTIRSATGARSSAGPSLYVSAGDGLHGQLGAITDEDVLIAISKGGESDELNEHARRAKDRGALVIAMTSDAQSALARLADLRLVTTTPDESDLGGMIAMGSALANCALGDALVAVTMSRRERAWERFEHTHPGGAVGKEISARGGGTLAPDRA